MEVVIEFRGDVRLTSHPVPVCEDQVGKSTIFRSREILKYLRGDLAKSEEVEELYIVHAELLPVYGVVLDVTACWLLAVLSL